MPSPSKPIVISATVLIELLRAWMRSHEQSGCGCSLCTRTRWVLDAVDS